MPEHRRRHHLAEAGHHRRHRIVVGASARSSSRRPERRGELGEQRPVGVERLQRPLFRRRDGRLDGGDVELHHVGDVEAGDVGELGVLEAHARVDVGRRNGRGGAGQRAAPGGRQQCELAGGVPVQRTLTRQRPGEITEHGQAGERIAGRIATERVDGIVRIVVVGHDVDATAIVAPRAFASPVAVNPASAVEHRTSRIPHRFPDPVQRISCPSGW